MNVLELNPTHHIQIISLTRIMHSTSLAASCCAGYVFRNVDYLGFAGL